MAASESKPNIMFLHEAEAYLGITHDTLLRFIRRGMLTRYKVIGTQSYCLKRSEVEALLQEYGATQFDSKGALREAYRRDREIRKQEKLLKKQAEKQAAQAERQAEREAKKAAAGATKRPRGRPRKIKPEQQVG